MVESAGMVEGKGYSLMELMVCTAAHQLENNKTAVIGTGIPLAAAMLAQRTTAPDLVVLFESGSIAPILETLPVSVGASNTQTRAIAHSSMFEIMEASQRGMVDYVFLGAAQIDMYGNLNSTMIGDDYDHPKVRLPGSGGANDLASLCWRALIVMPHDLRRFVPRVDFVTSPGYLTGPGAREAAGLPPDSGPYKVISSLAVLGFDPESKRMRLESLHPGVRIEQVIANTGFELLYASPLRVTEEPSSQELKILREQVDPRGEIINKPTA
jgi:glutaconate CoA-transferase subunit B